PCGDNLVLTPSVVDEKGIYKWNNGHQEAEFQVKISGKYWVAYEVLEDNCLQMGTDTFYVEVSGKAEVKPIIEVSGDYLHAYPYDLASYQWYQDGQEVPGATDYRFKVEKNGTYHVVISDLKGCYDTSDV